MDVCNSQDYCIVGLDDLYMVVFILCLSYCGQVCGELLLYYDVLFVLVMMCCVYYFVVYVVVVLVNVVDYVQVLLEKE